MENGANWKRRWHLQLELRRLRPVAGRNAAPGPLWCIKKITLSVKRFRVLFNHNSSSPLLFFLMIKQLAAWLSKGWRGKTKRDIYIILLAEFTWKGWARHSDGANQSRSRELADLHSSGGPSSACRSEQCIQVYIGWLRGTIWVNKAVQAQPRLTAAPWALSCICLSQEHMTQGENWLPRCQTKSEHRRQRPRSLGIWVIEICFLAGDTLERT